MSSEDEERHRRIAKRLTPEQLAYLLEVQLEQYIEGQFAQAAAYIEGYASGEKSAQNAVPLEPQTQKKISANELLTRYYRRKQYNPKLLLKDICAEFGLSYGYVRRVKVAFDKRKKPRNKGNI